MHENGTLPRAAIRETTEADPTRSIAMYILHTYIPDERTSVRLGLSAKLRLLVVIHCYRADDAVIRLISARKATPSERAQYDARWTR